ncbi:SpoIIE family protein phosphatase [Agrobacterium vitis]|uniref:SpoIIE family protein phosphatase n=1 Tax=Agrobacterium vitis TaxID=373 RepID=A0AAE4WCK3_AGRVI|nr:SpoIIE family protein phosphatase [Agrobacterium vitis]MCF1499342.1 SpoIIE family protein phosphatase [Allorhizobium sp. Av2]MCM2439406.1 SpoIIE family protein phosphatase [Agrobacterium vitis]MUZ57690.1 SpoIIE family protein phosphatase [Agrobacterium vitis]
MSKPTAEPSGSLFARYNRIMRGTFLAVLVVASALLYLQYTQQRDANLLILSQRLQEQSVALDAILKSSADAVKAMRMQGETWYATHPGSTAPSVLLQSIIASQAQGKVTLDSIPAPWTPGDVGNLTVGADLVDPPLLKDMEMALDLNTSFKSVKANIPNAAWIYYTSKRGFINIYPWIASSKFAYSDTLLEKAFYRGVTPEKNPDRSVLWTEAYLDEAGQGLMVTASSAIYDGDTFRGAVSLDLTLNELNTIVGSWQLQFGTLFIINDHDQLLAHPSLITPGLTAVLPAAAALPNNLGIDTVRHNEAVLGLVGDYYVEMLTVKNAPFSLVLVVPRNDLMLSSLKTGMLTVALLVGGLTLIILLSNLLTRREAISPAQQLVRYIEDESRGAALAIPHVPPAWRPWFETIRRVFNAHSQLISIQQELDVARRMQQSIVPTRFPSRRDLALFARMIPAKEVGGDFYDYFWLSDTRIGVVIADVSGKGVPAALFMAVARTLLRATAPAANGPGSCLTMTNNLLAQDNDATMFVTLFYGIIDVETNELVYANGGHNPPFVLDKEGAVRSLPATKGMALGVLEDMVYEERSVRLEPGSTLLLYTDGITEAFNPSGEDFTEERLERAFSGCVDLPVEECLETIVTAVTTFASTAPQSDDITCLAVRYFPPRDPTGV